MTAWRLGEWQLGLPEPPDIIDAPLGGQTSATWDEGDGCVNWSGLATLVADMGHAMHRRLTGFSLVDESWSHVGFSSLLLW
jgi:hypothetical protein